MYLFSELQKDFSSEPVHPAARRNFFPRTTADDVADRSIEGVLSKFRKESPNYDPHITLLDEDRWGTTLWAITAATHRARSEVMPRGHSGPGQPPLDALGVELIRKCFIEAFGIGGGIFHKQNIEQGTLFRRKELIPIHLDGMVSSINYWEWNSRPKKTRYSKEWSFYLSFGAAREKLTFTADLKTETENPRIQGEVARISAVRLSGTKKEGPVGDGARAIQDTLRSILRDQVRRTTLADRYAATPETIALSEPLQELFLQILKTADVPLSETALGALAFGRFPFNRMSYPSNSFETVFLRGCSRCRYPTSLILEPRDKKPSRAQRNAAAQVTNQILSPWHSKVCGHTPEELWRKKRLEDEGYGPRRISAESNPFSRSRKRN